MFYVVSGIGHCGTQWLGAFLDRPDDGMVCWHEQKFRVVPHLNDLKLPWIHDLEYTLNNGYDPRYDVYVQYMRERQQEVAVVGDAHSWEPFMLPELTKRLPVSRIVYLVRNGVQNMHSFYYHNTQISRTSWFYRDHLRRYGDLLGVDWDALDDWGRFCCWWGANVRIAEELSKVAPVETVRLEDLLAKPETLVALTKNLQHLSTATEAEAAQHAGIDLNRKVAGRRDADYLWTLWTDHQRAVFEQVCGDTMRHYGYEIPGPPGNEFGLPDDAEVEVEV